MLWSDDQRTVPPGRDLRRSHFEGHEARRAASAGGEQIRDGDQLEDGCGAGNHGAPTMLGRADEVIE